MLDLPNPIRICMLVAMAGVLACLLAPAVSTAQTAVQRPAASVSVEDFVRRAQFTTYVVSPDGNKLASLVPINGRNNLVVVDLEKRSRTNITNFNEYDVDQINWITNDRVWFRTISARDVTGRSTYQGSYAINIDGSEIRNIDSFRGTPGQANFVRVIDRQSGDMIMAANLRRRDAVDLYRVNTASGKLDLLTFDSPANTSRFLVDTKNDARFAWSSDFRNSFESQLWYRTGPEAKWELIHSMREGGEYWEPMMFLSSNPRKIIVRSNIGRDKFAIYYYDMVERKFGDLIAEHTNIDLGSGGEAGGDFINPTNPLLLLADPNKSDDEARLVGVFTHFDKPVVTWFDPDLQAMQDRIDRALPGRFNRFSTVVMLGRKAIVSSSHPDYPVRTYMFDPIKGAIEELPASRPWLNDVVMPQRQFTSYPARDGLVIPAFLTLPVGAENKRLPLIVHIHGGPYLRDYGLLPTRPEGSFFASRGYAVLEPEPRGSKGFGNKHFRAGWGTWGQAMQDDITDGVRALVDRGIVDPKRVCLYGGSYGGYATLQGLVREPDMFRCGLATVAVTDLELFQETTWGDIPVQFKSMQDWFAERVGSPSKDQAKLAANSPLRNAAKIKAPVLLMMGEADVRVPLVHGNRMRDALKAAGVPHEYHVYVGEGHGWNKEANRFDFYKRAEAFFAAHLKP